MSNQPTIIQQAEFNPRIKTYVLIYVGLLIALTFVGIPLLIIWFFGLGQYCSKRYYNNLKCTLTTRHLQFKKGVFIKVEKTIPLENIQDLTFIENPLLKYFDLLILKIETAGQSNPKGSDMKLIGIQNTADFKEKVLHQREQLATLGKNSGESKDESLQLLSEIKDILKEIRDKA